MNKNIEIMKKLIEEKSKGTNSNKGIKPQKVLVKFQRALELVTVVDYSINNFYINRQ